MIPQIEVDAFWAATVECLVRFHGYTESRARDGVAAFRDRVSRAPISRPEEMVYHDEPFNVACDIAGCELDQDSVMKSTTAFSTTPSSAQPANWPGVTGNRRRGFRRSEGFGRLRRYFGAPAHATNLRA